MTGFLSLFIAAAFLLQIVNYKRMLAYSSIENMGILFLGTALGPAGLFAALLHSAAHSLAKASLFLTSGNILHLYGTKKDREVRGLLRREPRTGWALDRYRSWPCRVSAVPRVPEQVPPRRRLLRRRGWAGWPRRSSS